MIPQEKIVKKLETDDQKIPFDDWYFSIKDKKTRQVIASKGGI